MNVSQKAEEIKINIFLLKSILTITQSDRKYKKSPKTTDQRKNNEEKVAEKDLVNLPLRDVEILDIFKEFVKTKMKELESEDIPPLRLSKITQENNDLSDINSDHDSIQSHYSQSTSKERTSSSRLISKKINERSKALVL
ncbi:2791_t:CDS:2 [Funneliformis caledonium]|uniref:2791_t:CDS:1 n=1 Tax=Funneliformis caledonium TaxID=1117310 RepID=A0A9N9NNB1_9GLOM|nr:2791_t:CDS:2 [Funneliformis caledonium]